MSNSVMESRHRRPAVIERWGNRARARATSPQFLVSLALLAVLVYLVLVPLVQLIWRTVTWGEGDRRLSPAAVEGEITGFHWTEALFGPSSNAMLFEPLANSLFTGLFAAVFALLLGGILAWLVTRTDMPGTGLAAADPDRSLRRPFLRHSPGLGDPVQEPQDRRDTRFVRNRPRLRAARMALLRTGADHHHHVDTLFPLRLSPALRRPR